MSRHVYDEDIIDDVPEIDIEISGMDLSLTCKECDSSALIQEGTCTTCLACGWSECSACSRDF